MKDIGVLLLFLALTASAVEFARLFGFVMESKS